uniref:Uncharacterized protein n=1 Tax=Oryza sativa subsp. japonica TaxID=39947 RepID=Q6ESF4_ORYSJ|nr:hypothetical protein [Oryza sativa Japonica Group]
MRACVRCVVEGLDRRIGRGRVGPRKVGTQQMWASLEYDGWCKIVEVMAPKTDVMENVAEDRVSCNNGNIA